MDLQKYMIFFVFPGQGSQSVGMGKELAQAYPVARQVFEEADQILGFSISRLAWEGPESELNDTLNTQPALLVHSVAALRVLEGLHPEMKPAFVAGHSMGEVTALVAANSLPYPEALQLARTRGRLMKEAGQANPGGMAAIIGLDIPTLDKVCADASQAAGPGEVVQVANDNSPGQVVISGSRAALEKAVALAKEAGARRAIPLAVSIAAHSPLMASAQVAFGAAVDAAPITNASAALIGNVAARAICTRGELRTDLRSQLTNRVRWTESVQYMAAQAASQGKTPLFIEIGSGSVLCGLIKRIEKEPECFNLGNPADFEKLI